MLLEYIFNLWVIDPLKAVRINELTEFAQASLSLVRVCIAL